MELTGTDPILELIKIQIKERINELEKKHKIL